MYTVEVEGLGFRRGDREILREVSFSVRPGEIFGLLGPNGAGKTTLFQLLVGQLRPSSGRILIGGEDSSGRAARARMGVVFQRPSLDAKLTARENLELSGRLYRMPSRELEPRLIELLDLVELLDRADEPVERYSEGMKRRLELARALVHRPRLLVLDEPTQGLDEAGFRKIWQRLTELRRRDGTTLVLATHRAEEAERCDRLAVLDGGALAALDTPESLRRRVGGDVVVVEADEPENLREPLAARFGIRPLVADGAIRFEAPRAHELLPRMVESFPPGRLRSVSLRRPTLADVFLNVTGHALAHEVER